MYPEEKLAERLVKKRNLIPPFDLYQLVSEFADIEETEFPVPGDGMSIGLGGRARPSILLNTNQYHTRKKFTLAHEFGHVMIPWHVGTILSNESAFGLHEYEYSLLESEANRFAAELLMPTEWIKTESRNIQPISSFFTKIINDSGVSRDAALIKIFNVVDQPLIAVECLYNGEIVKKFTPKNSSHQTPSLTFLQDKFDLKLAQEHFNIPYEYEKFHLGDKTIHAWLFSQVEFNHEVQGEWREILNEIVGSLSVDDPHRLKQSINAKFAAKYQRNKNKMAEGELCSNILVSFSGFDEYKEICSHPLFKSYIIKRVAQLLDKDGISPKDRGK